ncbi:MAG: amidohydrolase family protein, partial [Traorella sp.]
AIKEMLDKKMPLFVVCKTPMEVHSLLHVTKDYDIDLVLASGLGLQDCEKEILERKPAIISSVRVDGFNADLQDGDYELLYRLYKKGINVSLASNVDGKMCSREEVLWNGIDMYKVCHDEEAVIQMMTYNNAKVLGVDHLTGSIEVGKRADLVIYSNHPIKTYQAEILLTLSNGKAIYRKGDEMKCFI